MYCLPLVPPTKNNDFANRFLPMIKAFSLAVLAMGISAQITHAQLCTGSLGDPVINETFGAGFNKLPVYKTSFDNVNGCPPKGAYTLSNFLFGCGNRTWGQMVGDHTGDYNGNYMLVNAESTPGTVYRDTAKGLCSNTFYQFGVYITTVMTKLACSGNPVLPNIKYMISTLQGTVLALDSTGFLAVADEKSWKLYGLSFVAPAGVSDVVISITVTPAYGCGSAFALDDITLRACGPSLSASIDGSPGPAEVCANYKDPFIITAAYSAGFADPVLQWQRSTDSGKTWVDIAGETGASYAVTRRSSGSLSFRVAIAERNNIASLKCRINSNRIFTSIHPVKPAAAPQQIFGCLGKNFFLPAPDAFAEKVLWTGPNGFSSTQTNASIPNISYADTGLYQFNQVYAYGCTTLDTFYLKVYPGTSISVQPVTPVCEGQQEQLFVSATDSVAYQWTPAAGLSDPGIANPVATPREPVVYKVLATNRYGCKDSAFIKIDVYLNPAADAGPDKTILAGDTAVLNGSVKGSAVSYYWQPAAGISNTQVATPAVYPSANTNYTLTVQSAVGCGTATDNVLVKVYSSFLVPNAFTPNGDGKNDVFEILALDNYTVGKLLVYNRYGQLIFSSKGTYKSWDGRYRGTPQPQGMYVYYIEMKSPGRPAIIKKGSLLLIR